MRCKNARIKYSKQVVKVAPAFKAGLYEALLDDQCLFMMLHIRTEKMFPFPLLILASYHHQLTPPF